MPAHEQPVHRPSIFAPIIEKKNTEQRLRVQATYEPTEFFFYIYKQYCSRKGLLFSFLLTKYIHSPSLF